MVDDFFAPTTQIPVALAIPWVIMGHLAFHLAKNPTIPTKEQCSKPQNSIYFPFFQIVHTMDLRREWRNRMTKFIATYWIMRILEEKSGRSYPRIVQNKVLFNAGKGKKKLLVEGTWLNPANFTPMFQISSNM